MRQRVSFAAGLAVGFVAGARAGRERYEQLKKLARRLLGSSAVQQASHTITIKSSQLTKSAASQVEKAVHTAKNKASERIPRQHGRRDDEGHDVAVDTTEYKIDNAPSKLV